MCIGGTHVHRRHAHVIALLHTCIRMCTSTTRCGRSNGRRWTSTARQYTNADDVATYAKEEQRSDRKQLGRMGN